MNEKVDWDEIKENKQVNIDIATAWNTTKELVLHNEFKEPRSKELSGKEFAALIKANFFDVYMTLRELRKSVNTATEQSAKAYTKATEPVEPEPVVKEEEFI